MKHTGLWIIRESVEAEQIAYQGDYRFVPELKYLAVEAFTHIVQYCVTLVITFEHAPSIDSC